MTRIPKVGDEVLYVLKPEKHEPNSSIVTPAEFRAAKITKVWNYNLGSMCVNLAILTDGLDDQKLFNAISPSIIVSPGQPWMRMTNVMYDASKGMNSFHFPQEGYDQISTLTVVGAITHGRELIRDGAVGVWDTAKNTITFNRVDIENLSNDQEPAYTADEFINWHGRRLQQEAGVFFVIRTRKANADGTNRESPDERRKLVNNLLQKEMEGEPSYYPGANVVNARRYSNATYMQLRDMLGDVLSELSQKMNEEAEQRGEPSIPGSMQNRLHDGRARNRMRHLPEGDEQTHNQDKQTATAGANA